MAGIVGHRNPTDTNCTPLTLDELNAIFGTHKKSLSNPHLLQPQHIGRILEAYSNLTVPSKNNDVSAVSDSFAAQIQLTTKNHSIVDTSSTSSHSAPPPPHVAKLQKQRLLTPVVARLVNTTVSACDDECVDDGFEAGVRVATEAVKEAISYDNSAQYNLAYEKYANAIELFCECIRNLENNSNRRKNGPRRYSTNAKVISERINSYISRLHTLELTGGLVAKETIEKSRFKNNRLKVLEEVVESSSFDAASQGELYYNEANFCLEQNDKVNKRKGLLLYAISLDYLMAHCNAMSKLRQSVDRKILTIIKDALDKSEQISKLNH